MARLPPVSVCRLSCFCNHSRAQFDVFHLRGVGTGVPLRLRPCRVTRLDPDGLRRREGGGGGDLLKGFSSSAHGKPFESTGQSAFRTVLWLMCGLVGRRRPASSTPIAPAPPRGCTVPILASCLPLNTPILHLLYCTRSRSGGVVAI